MAAPILGIHPCQMRILDHQEILTVLLFRGDRPILRAGDDNRSIRDHDFIVRPLVPRIEGECDPIRYQACDSRDGG